MLGCHQTFHDCVVLPGERRHDNDDGGGGEGGDEGVDCRGGVDGKSSMY